ncbi:hypothetical protein HOD38_03775 [archaeon]|jgi:hypothetical protein|nr:hypothetical protein [archaeon]MBT4397360.1 hypothetical protein [archaeon]MBT4440740.1 hypothetical protein [archaeon]
MDILKLGPKTASYVPELAAFYEVELGHLRGMYGLDEIIGFKAGRDLELLHEVASGNTQREIYIALGVDGFLEGVLEVNEHKDVLMIGDILWIIAGQKGAGIGSQMLDHYLAETSVDIAICGVRNLNVAPKALFTGRGFEETVRLENKSYYGKGLTDAGKQRMEVLRERFVRQHSLSYRLTSRFLPDFDGILEGLSL